MFCNLMLFLLKFREDMKEEVIFFFLLFIEEFEILLYFGILQKVLMKVLYMGIVDYINSKKIYIF